MTKPTHGDTAESLEVVWDALHAHRESNIPEGRDATYDDEWSDITTAMAWITERLGLEISTADDHTNGELVPTRCDAPNTALLREAVRALNLVPNFTIERRYTSYDLCAKIDAALRREVPSVDEIIEAAACVWEHAQELNTPWRRNARSVVHDMFDQHGTAAVRGAVCDQQAMIRCALDWSTSREHAEGLPFDWEFVPRWFNDHFDWGTLNYVFSH